MSVGATYRGAVLPLVPGASKAVRSGPALPSEGLKLLKPRAMPVHACVRNRGTDMAALGAQCRNNWWVFCDAFLVYYYTLLLCDQVKVGDDVRGRQMMMVAALCGPTEPTITDGAGSSSDSQMCEVGVSASANKGRPACCTCNTIHDTCVRCMHFVMCTMRALLTTNWHALCACSTGATGHHYCLCQLGVWMRRAGVRVEGDAGGGGACEKAPPLVCCECLCWRLRP